MTRINQEIDVRSFSFKSGAALKSFPLEIEWDGRFVTFVGDGLRYLVGQGIQLFDMSGTDGMTYRLKSDGQHWTLVGTRAGA